MFLNSANQFRGSAFLFHAKYKSGKLIRKNHPVLLMPSDFHSAEFETLIKLLESFTPVRCTILDKTVMFKGQRVVDTAMCFK